MNSFEVITKYLPTAVDKYFREESKTAILENGSKFIDVSFQETGYVKIASMLMDGLSDYYKVQEESFANPNGASYAGNLGSGYRDGFQIGGVSLTWEIFKLQWVRSRQFKIDFLANEESAGVVIGNAIEEFNRVKVIPEVDVCRFGVIADTCAATLGNLLTETIQANQIISKFNAGIEWLKEHEVPESDQIIFVNPSVMTLIRNTTELNKFITQGEYKSGDGIDFTVNKYNGIPIIEVPSNRFFTNVLLTQNGYRTQATSNIINYMIVSKKAVVPIRKLEWNKVYGPEEAGIAGFHGYLVNYLLYHGVVIPKNKIVGCYTSVSQSAASTKVDLLSVDVRAGSVQYGWKLKNYFTNPAGLRGQVVYAYYDSSAQSGTYAKDGFTLGATITGTAGSDYKVIIGDNEQAATSGQTSAYFAVVDASGTIIAVTSDKITLTRHA